MAEPGADDAPGQAEWIAPDFARVETSISGSGSAVGHCPTLARSNRQAFEE
jgi:hypothetical protein